MAGAFDHMADAIYLREADRRKAEHTRAQMAAIVESSSDTIVSRTFDGTITSWNKGAESLFGYTAEEMIGQSILRLIPKNARAGVEHNFARIQRGEHIESYEAVRLRKMTRPLTYPSRYRRRRFSEHVA